MSSCCVVSRTQAKRIEQNTDYSSASFPSVLLSPSSASSSFFSFFFRPSELLTTRTLGSPNGLWPSCQRPSNSRVSIRSLRFSTFRARSRCPLRCRLLSIVTVASPRVGALESLSSPKRRDSRGLVPSAQTAIVERVPLECNLWKLRSGELSWSCSERNLGRSTG